MTVTDALGGTNTKTYSLVINAPPTIATGSLPDGERTVGYNTTVAAAGGTAGATSSGYTWAASGLPNGLTINSASGVISGTPTQFGPFPITVTATDGAGVAVSTTFNVSFTDAPSITGPGTLPNGTVNVVYPGATIINAGGKGPFTWSATGMPPGLTIDSSGTISGIPTAAGTFTPTITVTDLFDATASHGYTIVISGTPVIMSGGLPSSTVNQPYNFTVLAGGGTGALTWSASGLPAGVTINPSSGLISGTPTVTGPYTVTINLSDSLGATAAPATFSFSINDVPSINTSSLPDAVQGAAYSTVLTGVSGTTPYIWSATVLPAGLTISSGGVISGTPTGTGTSTVNIKLTDASGATAIAPLTLNVRSAMSLSGDDAAAVDRQRSVPVDDDHRGGWNGFVLVERGRLAERHVDQLEQRCDLRYTNGERTVHRRRHCHRHRIARGEQDAELLADDQPRTLDYDESAAAFRMAMRSTPPLRLPRTAEPVATPGRATASPAGRFGNAERSCLGNVAGEWCLPLPAHRYGRYGCEHNDHVHAQRGRRPANLLSRRNSVRYLMTSRRCRRRLRRPHRCLASVTDRWRRIALTCGRRGSGSEEADQSSGLKSGLSISRKPETPVTHGPAPTTSLNDRRVFSSSCAI